MSNMSSMKDHHDLTSVKLRLFEALDKSGTSTTEIANTTHKHRRTIERYRSVHTSDFFSPIDLSKVCYKYNINVHWVYYGDLPMFREDINKREALVEIRHLIQMALNLLGRL